MIPKMPIVFARVRPSMASTVHLIKSVERDLTFFGVSSTVPITSVTLHDQSNNASTFVDNVEFPAAAATPEPATIVSGSLGVLVLAGCAWRRWLTARLVEQRSRDR
jgi:hypothetical protein